MNSVDALRTIENMVKFIQQEAQEKAAEIAVSAEEEFNSTKLQLIEAEKQRVKREFERKEGTVEVKKKVEFSKQLNESRIKVLQAREDAVHAVLLEGFDQLVALAKDQKRYKQLLVDLLVQSLYKLKEPSVIVRCREMDLTVVRDALPSAQNKYKQEFGSEAPQVEIDTSAFLPPPPKPGNHTDDEFASCCGGVVVTSSDGKIVCSNTLDDRLRITYAQNLPAIRTVLFGATA